MINMLKYRANITTGLCSFNLICIKMYLFQKLYLIWFYNLLIDSFSYSFGTVIDL